MSLVLCAKALPEGWRLLSRVAGTVARVERFLHSPAGPSCAAGRVPDGPRLVGAPDSPPRGSPARQRPRREMRGRIPRRGVSKRPRPWGRSAGRVALAGAFPIFTDYSKRRARPFAPPAREETVRGVSRRPRPLTAQARRLRGRAAPSLSASLARVASKRQRSRSAPLRQRKDLLQHLSSAFRCSIGRPVAERRLHDSVARVAESRATQAPSRGEPPVALSKASRGSL